ncbi:MAG: DNA-processing protein DprA, partial [Gaiellaceae bacterium]
MAIAVVRRRDRGYPPLLAELHDPPERLHIRGGEIELLTRPAVAVVGARSCSPYGREVGRSLA